MRRNLRRIFAAFLITAAIATSARNVHASKITVNMPQTIYQTKNSEHLSSGVVHENLLKFTTAGWWNLNVLRVNLEDPHTDIQGLIGSKGVSARDKVSTMVQNNKAIAGINGDYFNFAPMASAMGTLINNGEVISSPIERAYALPTFFIDVLGNADIGFLDRNITSTNLRSGQSIFVNTVNKVTKDFDTVTLLNKHWGKNSIGNRFHKDLIEVVVQDNIVIDVRKGQVAVPIPENGYVLAVRGERHQDLHTFLLGDELNLHVSTTPDANNIKFAVGGGSIILKDGELANSNINSKGNNPRSGIGVSQDGKELILVTIDGRDSSFKGVSQEIFGAIMKEQGAHNALNLDGGGSTSMAIKSVDEETAKLVNKPSDGSERLVVNAVGVFSNAPEGELSYLKVSTDDPNMFIDTTRNFTVKGYDEYHNPVVLDKSQLTFTQAGVEGLMEGNGFKASGSGKATITANYGEIAASTDVKVLGSVKHISTSLTSFNLDLNSEKVLPVFTAKDENGFTAKLDPKDISFTTTNEIGSVTNGVFHSGDTSLAGTLTAKLGNGVANISVSVGSNASLVEGFENIKNFKLSSHPAYVKGGIDLSKDAKEGNTSISLKYDFSGGEETRAGYLEFKNTEAGLALGGVPRKLGLWIKGDGNGSWLRGKIKDKKGEYHTLDFVKSLDFDDWRYVTTDIPTNVSYPVSLEQIYIVETDPNKKHSGEILIDGLTAAYPPISSPGQIPTPSSLKDDKNKSSELGKDGFSIGVTVEPKGLNDLVGYDASGKVKEAVNKHRISAFIGGISEDFSKGLTNKARINTNNLYSKDGYKDVAFINLDTSKNGIRSSNTSQWGKLKSDLTSITANNIIIFSSSPIFGTGGFADKLEADLLHDYLVEVRESGKNIFVVNGGNSNSLDLRDGVRYINLKTKALSKAEDIYDLSIIEFMVNGSEVTYEIKALFPKATVETN